MAANRETAPRLATLRKTVPARGTELRFAFQARSAAPSTAAPSTAAPSTSGSASATQPQVTAGARPSTNPLQPQDIYQASYIDFSKGSYALAMAGFREFIRRFPDHPLAGNAQYWLGETYYVRNDFRNASVAFAEGYQKYPDSQKAPDNLLKLAMALGQQGQKQNACVALAQLDKRYPNASANIKDRAGRAKKNYGCS